MVLKLCGVPRVAKVEHGVSMKIRRPADLAGVYKMNLVAGVQCCSPDVSKMLRSIWWNGESVDIQ